VSSIRRARRRSSPPCRRRARRAPCGPAPPWSRDARRGLGDVGLGRFAGGARASASLRAWSSRASETKPFFFSEAWRSASRRELAAVVQASLTRCAAIARCASARACCAFWSSFHSLSSNWPFFTLSPSLTPRYSMRPPMMVDSLVRWQASTVPARVFTTVASTLPRSTELQHHGSPAWPGFSRRRGRRRPPTTSSTGRTRRRRKEVFMARLCRVCPARRPSPKGLARLQRCAAPPRPRSRAPGAGRRPASPRSGGPDRPACARRVAQRRFQLGRKAWGTFTVGTASSLT
jgi:hypothetical protein